MVMAFTGTFLSCQKYVPSPAAAVNPPYVSPLRGQTWVMTQYRVEPGSNIIPASDTIVFIDDSKCAWNGVQGNYGAGAWFSFDNTPFGELRASPSPNLYSFGEISGLAFGAYITYIPQTYDLWMHRI
jgi:hypothetical protein